MYLNKITKDGYYASGKHTSYIIRKEGNKLYFHDLDISSGYYLHNREVTKYSFVFSVDDFVECDSQGNILPTIKSNIIPRIKGNKMSKNNNVNYIGGEYRVAVCTYDINQTLVVDTYNFKVDIDSTMEVNSLAVVESRNGYGIVRVTELLDNCIDNAEQVKKATAWIVDVIDTSRQDQRKDATRQREYIIQQLDEKKAQMESISMYALLAEHDPEAKKLLESLKELGQ